MGPSKYKARDDAISRKQTLTWVITHPGIEVYIDGGTGFNSTTTSDNGQFYFPIPLSENEIELTIQIDENSITDSLDIDVKVLFLCEKIALILIICLIILLSLI